MPAPALHPSEGGRSWQPRRRVRLHTHFTLTRDDYLAHYHKRSNVESTFSVMKRKFGDAVRSKTEVAIRNEVLCHNLVVNVHEMHELGIETGFSKPHPRPQK